jgi:hypothetical protein
MVFSVFIKHAATKLLACGLRNVNSFATYVSTINFLVICAQKM